MVRFDTRPMPRRRGVGDSMDDLMTLGDGGFGSVYDGGNQTATVDDPGLFDTISVFAQGGSNQLGDLSNFLVRSGYTLEVVRNALQNLTAVNAPAPVVNYAQQELRYLNNTPGAAQNNTGLFIALGLGALLLFAIARNND